MVEKTVHGRTEIRSAEPFKRGKVSNDVLMFYLIAFIIVAGVFAISIGVSTLSKNAHKSTKVSQIMSETEQKMTKNEQIMEKVNDFGRFDNRIFTNEPELKWDAGSSDFVPITVDMDYETQEFIFYLCESYNIDWTLVMAVISQESNFNASAISSTNDYGLMQINEGNHKWLSDAVGVTDFLDSKQNVRAGVFVLRKLFEEYSDTEMVLMAYNMGEAGAKRLWNEGIYSTNYTRGVRNYQSQYNNELGKEKS